MGGPPTRAGSGGFRLPVISANSISSLSSFSSHCISSPLFFQKNSLLPQLFGSPLRSNPSRLVVAAATKKPPKLGAGPVPFRKSKWVRQKERQEPAFEKQRRWEGLISAVLADEKRTGQTLQAAREQGWLQRSDVVGMLVRLKQLQRWNAVLEVFAWLRAEQQQGWWSMSERDYGMLVAAAARCGDVPLAESAVAELRQRLRVPPNAVVLTALLGAYSRSGRLRQAEVLLKDMEERGPAPTAPTYQNMLVTYAQHKRLDAMEQLFRQLVANSGWGEEREEEKEEGGGGDKEQGEQDENVAKWLAATEPPEAPKGSGPAGKGAGHGSAGSQPGQAAAAAAAADGAAAPLPFRCRGVAVDAAMCNAVLDAYARAGRQDAALRLFRRMRANGVAPTLVTFNVLMAMFAREARSREAEATLKQLQAQGLRPDALTYTALLSAYGRAGKAEEAQAVFRDMVASRIRPTVVAYTALVDAYGRAEEPEKAEFLVKEMRRNRRFPTQATFNCLIAAHCRVGNMERAEALLRQMKWEARRKGEEAGEEQEGEEQEGEELEGEPPHESSVEAEVAEHGSPQSPERGKQGGQDESWHASAPLGGEAGDTQGPPVSARAAAAAPAPSAEQSPSGAGAATERRSRPAVRFSLWGTRIRDAGRTGPSAVTFNTLMEGYRRLGDVDGVVGAFERMLEAGVEPNAGSFCIVIGAYADVGDVEGAVYALEQMVEVAGIQPDRGVKAAVVAAWRAAEWEEEGEGQSQEAGSWGEVEEDAGEEGGLTAERKEELRATIQRYMPEEVEGLDGHPGKLNEIEEEDQSWSDGEENISWLMEVQNDESVVRD